MARLTAGKKRRARTTVLVVGEGHAEVVFVKHLRNLYTAGHHGFAVQVHNAHGYGAGNVIEQTIRRGRGLDFDYNVALLDTDVGWTEQVKARAKANKIKVVASSPCLEAWLLQILGNIAERDTQGHKAEFARRFGHNAHDVRVLAHFPREVLDAARGRVEPLNELLVLMGV